MNSFIPTLIAVLLAEIGGRAGIFARLPRLALAATLLGLAVGVAAFAGYSFAPTMNVQARTLMLGVALLLTGFGQFGKVSADVPATPVATLLFVWRSGAPFLAFAFALWRLAPISAAAGALAGLTGAAAIGTMLSDILSPVATAWLRRIAGITIAVIGIYALLWALRLIA